MCSLFGILDYKHTLTNKNLKKIISTLSRECAVRGTDATGIAYLSAGHLSIYKRPVPAHRFRFRIPNDCYVVMGHTRLTTQGSEKDNYNNHPFIGHVHNTAFALAHNGVLHNDIQLRTSEKLPPTNIKTDSYIAVQLIQKQRTLNFGSLRYMAEKVEGSFSFTLLDQLGNLYLIKGDSPLCIFHYPTIGMYMYASTEDILNRAVKRLRLQRCTHEQIRTCSGDILKIDCRGDISCERFSYDNIHLWRQHGAESFPYLQSTFSEAYEHDYWEELRFMAGSFGYREEDVDRLQEMGYSPDEVEEVFYFCDERERY